MDDTSRTITGPLHPLVAAYRQAKREQQAFLARNRERAAALAREHVRHSESYSSTIRTSPIAYEGPSENIGHLAQLDGFVTVYDSDLRGAPELENMYAAYTAPGWPRGGARQRHWHAQLDAITAREAPGHAAQVQRYRKLIGYSYEAAPQVAIMLAIGAASEHLTWDTGESIHGAATRICLNMANGLLEAGELIIDTDRIVTAAREDFEQTRTIAQFSRNYLDNKDAILTKLKELEIEMGGKKLASADAAEMARISPSTWRAYVTRGTAPLADDTEDARSPRWWQVTVAAWSSARSA